MKAKLFAGSPHERLPIAAPLSMSAAANAQSAQAAAASAPETPRRPLHLLGSTSAPPPSPISTIADDAMSVVGHYLTQAEHFQLDKLNKSLRGLTDRTIETLDLTAEQAIALFASTVFPRLKTLTLTSWDNRSLAGLAATLAPKLVSSTQKPFALSLAPSQERPSPGAPVLDVRCLATLRLS